VVVSEERGENHWPAASYGQTLSHNAVLIIPRDSGIRTHNVSVYRNWLHRYFLTQLQYDHDGTLVTIKSIDINYVTNTNSMMCSASYCTCSRVLQTYFPTVHESSWHCNTIMRIHSSCHRTIMDAQAYWR